jgi:phosphoglycerol transferase MdoB-like AlkP superfamily enzyme
MCFVMEWLSRHSFLDACGFVVNHTGAYLFNSYLLFVCYSLCFITKRQTFVRMVISAVFVMLGIINCIILLNRVTPFGFTDLSMIGDLLTMQNTNYFTSQQAAISVAVIAIYALLMVRLFFKGKKTPLRLPFWSRLLLIVLAFASVPVVTTALQDQGVIAAYFGNLQQGYFDNGYVYGFATSVFDRGMSQPRNYNEQTISAIVEGSDQGESTIDTENMPNIVVVLLESFYDVSEASFIETDQDPIPYFHYLEENYSTGHLTVPVVGAGTCNSEFEVLTGMSCQFFGPGEYPQKTILKKTDCESFASDLKNLGYGSHVVHNNGGNFYSRANAFSMMGFDTFQSKEMLDITEYTPLGSWPTDDILIQATVDALDSTDTPDFVYTITVEAHGDYPTYEVESDPAIAVNCEGKTEEQNYAWSYYVNRIHDVDSFIQDYLAALDARGEDTLVIMFGDHLPTMGLTEDEIATGDLFQTKYITWNNFGMEKEDEDLTSYQLVSEYLNRLGIHEGTMTNYHQSMMAKGVEAGTNEYMTSLEALQYDLLYGERYAYGGVDLYPASDLEMGVADVTIDRAYFFNGKLHIYGDNFTKWSRVYVNGEKVSTTYVSGQCLTIKASAVENGDVISVCQLGSSNTVFRESNTFTVIDPNYVVPTTEEEDAGVDVAEE